MDVTVQHRPDQHRYELASDGDVIGKIDYRERDGVVTMYHTEVDPGHEGQGLGGRLVRGALDDVRERGLKVEPTCPFVARYIEQHPGDADLLA